MKKRQGIDQKFSTFLSFSDASSSPQTWRVELRLKRQINQQVQQHPQKTAEQWARHFLRVLQGATNTESLADRSEAEKYLSAYLQEPCYYAAQKIQRQFHSVRYQYSLEDLFQIGNLLANQPAKLFRSFNLEYQHTHLESYARTAIFRFIGNTIYTQDIEAKREKFSDYGLLRDLSTKELKEALVSRGIGIHQTDLLCLARQCFEAIYLPQHCHRSRTLEAPSQEALGQMVAFYHQRCAQLSLTTDLIDAQKMQAMLCTCIQSARDYRSRRVVVLEEDNLVSDAMPSLWETLIQIEEKQQIETLISEVFATIPKVSQTLMKLWLGLSLTQTEIATVLKHNHPELQKQYQVARHLRRSNRIFLTELLHQCSSLNPNLDGQAIELIQALIDDCLQSQCRRLIYAELEQLSQQSFIDQKEFIQAFEHQLEQKLNLLPMSLRLFDEKLIDVVNEWKRSIKALDR